MKYKVLGLFFILSAVLANANMHSYEQAETKCDAMCKSEGRALEGNLLEGKNPKKGAENRNFNTDEGEYTCICSFKN